MDRIPMGDMKATRALRCWNPSQPEVRTRASSEKKPVEHRKVRKSHLPALCPTRRQPPAHSWPRLCQWLGAHARLAVKSECTVSAGGVREAKCPDMRNCSSTPICGVLKILQAIFRESSRVGRIGSLRRGGGLRRALLNPAGKPGRQDRSMGGGIVLDRAGCLRKKESGCGDNQGTDRQSGVAANGAKR